MANFKPSVRIITEESKRDYYNNFSGRVKSPYQWIYYKTYSELKRNIKRHVEENYEDQVSVSRSKRGEWGEYFEIWEMVNKKPTIVKQG